jgi:hypothetical protein
LEGSLILPIVTQASNLFMIVYHIFCYLKKKIFLLIYYSVIYLDPYIFSIFYVTSVHCYMSLNSWLLSNPLTDCLSIKNRFCSLNIFMGHTFYSLGCFLFDLLPYRNKSDSLHYGLLFRGLDLLIKLYYNPPKWSKCCTS